MRQCLCFCLFAILLTSCASLTTRVTSEPYTSPSASKLQSGVIYRLPMKQYLLATTFEPLYCSQTGSTVQLEGSINVDVTEKVTGDPSQTYVIDYQMLSGLTKVANVEINLSESGLLTGINSTLADQTASVIKDSAAALFSVARGMSLNSLSINKTWNTKSVKKEACEVFNEKRAELKNTKNEYDKAKNIDKKIINLSNELAGLEKLRMQYMTDAEFQKKFGTEIQNEEAVERVKKVNLAIDETKLKLKAEETNKPDLEKLAKGLADIQAMLIFSGETQWFTPVKDNNTLEIKISSEKLASLFVGTKIEGVPRCSDANNNEQANNACLDTPVITAKAISLPEKPTFPEDDIKNKWVSENNQKVDLGIMYRLPAPVQLKISARSNTNAAAETVLMDRIVELPQFGEIGTLNLKNKVFDDNTLNVTFNPSGGINKVVFRSSAQAAAAANAAAGVSSSYFNFIKDRRSDKISAEKENVELDKIRRTDRVSAEKEQIDLDKSRAAANATIAAEDVKTLKDIQRIQALQTGTAAPEDVKLEILKTQTDILNQQLMQAKLKNQIAEELAKNAGKE